MEVHNNHYYLHGFDNRYINITGGLKGGIDIFEGPTAYGAPDSPGTKNTIKNKVDKITEILNLKIPNELNLETDVRNMNVLLIELNRTDNMLHDQILESYRYVYIYIYIHLCIS
jgi:hypothetical protein